MLYWVSPAKHLILKQQFTEPSLFNGIVYRWTYTVDSIKLNETPPQWLSDLYGHMVGKTRDEWAGREAPEFTLPDLTGHTTVLSAFRGKAVLLDFWGTYCGPCKEEMPTIEKLREEYADKGVAVWGITDDSAETAEKWLSVNGRTLPALIDAGRKVFSAYEINSIPVLVLIGRDGKVAKYWEGMQYEKDIRSALEQALR